MFSRYFQQELSNLRDLAAEFAKEYPALAPMLGTPTTDPDVERLLEGVAFLTGLVREKIDDELPEIIQGLMELIFPHYLRPIPSTTIVAFTPKPSLKETYTVPAGASLASKPVDGAQCFFRTCYDVEAHPLKLNAAYFEQPPGQAPSIVLAFEMVGLELADWGAEKLRLHLAGDYPAAANIYYLLNNHLESVKLSGEGAGSAVRVLGPESVTPVGFGDDEGMIPYPSQSFTGYRILQEFFILPQKFLFVDVGGFDKWTRRGAGSRFKMVFELKGLPFPPPRITADNFVLFAAPAVNVFPHEADPIVLDHRRNEYRVRAGGGAKAPYQVYSVDRVVGYQQGSVRPRNYQKFEMFQMESSNQPVYHVSFKRSPVGNAIDAMLSFTYPPGSDEPVPETLSIQLSCTNGDMAERLQIGDVSRSTSTSPELLEFRNIRPPTASVLPPLDKTLLWRLLSLYSLNYLPIAEANNLKSLLRLYIFAESRDQSTTYANNRRVEGVSGLEVKAEDRLVAGYMMRGQSLTLRIKSDHFASDGDLYLFGTVLHNFFSSYASLNSFTRFRVEEVLKGDVYSWPEKIGDRPLI